MIDGLATAPLTHCLDLAEALAETLEKRGSPAALLARGTARALDYEIRGGRPRYRVSVGDGVRWFEYMELLPALERGRELAEEGDQVRVTDTVTGVVWRGERPGRRPAPGRPEPS